MRFGRDEAGTDFGEEFEGVEAGRVIIDVSGGDEFVGLGDFDELEEATLDGFRGADNRA